METEWHTLGKVQYQKWTLYDLDWQRALGGSDLRDFVSAVAPFGGPIALLRDPKKLVKADAASTASRALLVFSASGQKLCEIPFAKFDEKDPATGRSNPLLFLGWTDEFRLLCVFENGSCVTFTLGGDVETRFAVLQPGAKDRIVSVEAWGGGFVALSEKMALIQALDLDSVRPKVSLLPDCGLSEANAPTCMAVIEPKFLKSIYPEVLLGTTARSLVVVSKENGAQDMQLQDSLKAPISSIAVGPSGVFMAVFSQDGLLTVMNTMLDKKVLTFDTQSNSTPLEMKWCGEDSVLLYWQKAGLIMVGPFGSWLRFPYDEGLVLAQEMDCCRVYRKTGHDMVMRVPTSVENIKGVGSTAPAAMLSLAIDAFDAGDAKADEHIRSILSQKQMEIAIKDCVTAAGSDFDYANQSAFLRAASYGKSFVDGGGAGTSAGTNPANGTNDADKLDDLDADATDLDPELFVEMCRKIRVLNALRQPQVGLPLTLAQFDRLSPEVVVSRLVAMRHHLLALKICEYLKVPTDRVLVHWACEKVKASSDMGDEELVALVRSKLKHATLVSYADIASCAERVNRRRLATMFLDLEENAIDQVPLLLSMGEFELALRKSLEANNTDLVFMTLFHLERTLPSLEELATVLTLDPLYSEAAGLMLQYYKASKSSKLRELSNACSDLSSAESAMLLSLKAPDVDDKAAALKDAMLRLTNAKQPAAAKLAEEQLELVQEQKKLEEKPENIKKRALVGLSVTATMKILIQDTKYEPKLAAVVAAFAKKFKVPDKRFYRVKIKALAETKQWDALQKFSLEKKTPPCGFKAFAVACLEQGEKAQAEAYTARITAVDEKFDTLMHLELYHDALQLAIKLKDPEKLTSVRNLCGDADICALADKAAVDLGFVS